MNQVVKYNPPQPYQTPRLETIKTWSLVTGVSLPIGASSLGDFMETGFDTEEQP